MSATMSGVDFKDLETKGFVVIPSFLSATEIADFNEDFYRQGIDTANSNYRLAKASPRTNARMAERAGEVLRRVSEQTGLRVDSPQVAWYFSTGKSAGVNFQWHQDHESFFQLQNHYDYLNFYIPIKKPRTDKSNLSVVPFDVLEHEDTELFRRMQRRGATHFGCLARMRLVYFDDGGDVHIIRGEMDRMAYTPMLAAGDLLLLRGDMIHRTQDSETERIAISFRASSAQTIVRRSRLAYGGLVKAKMMAKNPEPYQRMFRAFDQAGRDEMPAHEIRRLMDAVTVQPQSRWAFYRQLLREKHRAGVVGHFLCSLLRTLSLAVARKIINWSEKPAEWFGRAFGHSPVQQPGKG